MYIKYNEVHKHLIKIQTNITLYTTATFKQTVYLLHTSVDAL
jgi:hypothetical protein